MANLSVLAGAYITFSGGTMTVGAAPAKVTAVTLRRGNKGEIKGVATLPADPNFADYAVYALDSTSLTDPGFPGGSPILVGTASKFEDDTAKVGVRRHLWIVTRDKFSNPISPVAANAFYAGSIIPSLSSTLIVS